jgi:Glycogen recognition site of AMP-activated protein kinase
MLAASCNAPIVPLPEKDGQIDQSISTSISESIDLPSGGDLGLGRASNVFLQQQQQEALSNAVPFTYSHGPEGSTILSTRDGCIIQDELLAPIPLAKELRVVLPWLFAAPGGLDKDAAEFLASQLALSRLQVVDLPHIMLSNACAGNKGPWKLASDIAWVGSKNFPSPAVTTAATLHRIAHRCGGAASPPLAVGGTAAVLSYRPEDVSIAAEGLAVYLHLYCNLRAKDAAAAAGAALQCPAPALTVLESAVEELAACGKGWLQRVSLEWHYAGGSVEVAGDVIGGWDRTASLVFNVRHRKWRLQLWGLPPGLYDFKFIVDSHWCIDVAAPSRVDSYGNANNVCMVERYSDGLVSEAVQIATDAADGMAAYPATALNGELEEVEEDDRRYGEESEGISVRVGNDIQQKVDMYESSSGGGGGGGGSSSDEECGERRWREVSVEERLRSARFGASILAYYSKCDAVRRAPMRKH